MESLNSVRRVRKRMCFVAIVKHRKVDSWGQESVCPKTYGLKRLSVLTSECFFFAAMVDGDYKIICELA